MITLATSVNTVANERTCSEEGCTTVLSKYNDGKWCGLHGLFKDFAGTRLR